MFINTKKQKLKSTALVPPPQGEGQGGGADGIWFKNFKTYLAIAITTQNVKTINVRLFGNAPSNLIYEENIINN